VFFPQLTEDKGFLIFGLDFGPRQWGVPNMGEEGWRDGQRMIAPWNDRPLSHSLATSIQITLGENYRTP
jgi:hypothetical protein